MAVTASTMQRVRVNLDRMLADPKVVNTHLIQPAMTARAILMNQTASTQQVLVDGHCVGIRAWFIDSSATAEVAVSTDCTTPSGNQVSTDSKDYDTDEIAAAAMNAITARCDNEMTAAEELAAVTLRVITDLRRQLNELVITTLDAAAMDLVDGTGLPATWDYAGANAPLIDFPISDATWDNLGYLRLMANTNKIGPYITVSGASSFHNEWWKSGYQRFNDNERGIFQAFQDQGIYFDELQLDQILSRAATFLVGVNNVVFWNTSWSPSTPTEFSSGSNGTKFTFTQQDPELMYMRDGRLTPVVYEMEIEESCSARNAIGALQKQIKVYGRLVGGFSTSPTGPNNETGIIELSAISGL